MGGILGAVARGRSNVVPSVVEGLKRMRFKGYDSAGVAVVEEGVLSVYKDVGWVDYVAEKLGLLKLSSSVALGQTRYATHGRPTTENAHPFADCRQRVAVAGDGAISNYEKLKDMVVMSGHKLQSRSDFEVPAHVLEEELERDRGFVEALQALQGILEGFYAIAVLDRDSECIGAFASTLPLYVGISGEAFYVTNTLTALHGLADSYIQVEPSELVLACRGGVKVYRQGAEAQLKPPSRLEVDPALVDKGGFRHHMLREIYEVPYALLRTLSTVQEKYLQLAARLVLGAESVYIIANGTSLHAGMVASYYLSELVGVSPVVTSAAEFPLYYVENIGPGSLVVAISQSGETGDVLSSLYEAKLRGATILGVTNYIGSRLARLSNVYLPIAAGPELAVPATKTFTSTLLLLYLISLKASRESGRTDAGTHAQKVSSIKAAATALADSLPRIDEEAKQAVKLLKGCRGGYVVSRGITYPLALEAALKLKEVSYFHAEGVEAGEFKHGPFVLVEDGFFTGFIMPVERLSAEATYPLIQSAIEAGASTVVVGFEGDGRLAQLSGEKLAVIHAPPAERHLAPIVYAVPLQLLAYRLGVELGRPIDAPRYLTKAVTR
ncbi:glutamine--fructose-6-phosphate transaminase (isomerizing) [Infirmifilum sp. NZ]|uniref:glutamine--fructose-6-phosphate transaminase (isomerizing) n=1 Tax=Infirmifilum sp. NZ TaxID=2926850 RepID=UPI0027A7008E|nr:glutamine--fructose-6-phosphate transaminase (isomerizing) [Infirmifilum sp. NZ]UNQ73201.1 glutamine--fructose-6-phosphate transaminase (isomerizing) [Infirmifilum sp. NZ]